MEKNFLDFYKGKKVFITGNTGFKGSWMCKLLSMVGAVVKGYALTPPTEENLFEIAGIKNKIISDIGDINDLEKLQKSLWDFAPDIVIHMAAQPIVLDSYRDPVYTYRTNVMGTVHLLEAVRGCPSVKSLVNVTT
ncbi:MAG: GDP-mannose 4,6-dehydratase, partial [Oscillospiraceae bacterium]